MFSFVFTLLIASSSNGKTVLFSAQMYYLLLCKYLKLSYALSLHTFAFSVLFNWLLFYTEEKFYVKDFLENLSMTIVLYGFLIFWTQDFICSTVICVAFAKG